MAERRVVDPDVVRRDALRFQDRLRGSCWSCADRRSRCLRGPSASHASFLAHQVFDRRDRLLVRRGAGIEDVSAALLALVLHRIEQEAVQLLEYRQYRFARHRGPAAEHRRDFVLRQQLPRLFGKKRPVRGRVDDHRLDLLAEQPALLVMSSTIIRMVSFSVVSLIAIVPDSECSTPILIVPPLGEAAGALVWACAFEATAPLPLMAARVGGGPEAAKIATRQFRPDE